MSEAPDTTTLEDIEKQLQDRIRDAVARGDKEASQKWLECYLLFRLANREGNEDKI